MAVLANKQLLQPHAASSAALKPSSNGPNVAKSRLDLREYKYVKVRCAFVAAGVLYHVAFPQGVQVIPQTAARRPRWLTAVTACSMACVAAEQHERRRLHERRGQHLCSANGWPLLRISTIRASVLNHWHHPLRATHAGTLSAPSCLLCLDV